MENKPERFYNAQMVMTAVTTVGAAAYLLGASRGSKRGYIQGLKDGMVQGITEGKLEGYVSALSDVATVIRNAQE